MSDRGQPNQSWLPLAFAAAAAMIGVGAVVYQSNNQSVNRSSHAYQSVNPRRHSRNDSNRRVTSTTESVTRTTKSPTNQSINQSIDQSESQVTVDEFFQTLLTYVSSASGKVLLLGGYLILDSQYSGWVISMSARFHTYLSVLQPINQSINQLANQSHEKSAIDMLIAYNESCHPQWKLPSSIDMYRRHCYGYNQSINNQSTNSNKFACVFILYSPQRSTRLSEYWITLTKPTDTQYPCPVDSSTEIRQSINQSVDQSINQMERNPFVETCLYTVVHALSSILSFDHVMDRLKYPIFVHVEADHPFYSAQPIDQSINQPINPNLKTGLGSSAALVSSLTGALFECFGLNDPSIHRSITWLPLPAHLQNDPSIHQSIDQSVDHNQSMNDSFAYIHEDLSLTSASPDLSLSARQSSQSTTQSTTQSSNQLINQSFVPLSLSKSNLREFCHSVSQLCHCVAQGKVGSGFDVAAAFYGSSIYQRFDASIYQSINQPISSFSVGRFDLIKCLLPVISHEQHEARAHIDPSIRQSINNSSMHQSTVSLDSDSSLDSSDSESINQSCSLCQCLRDRQIWNHTNRPIHLPQSINLSLADVQGGASTPTMVKQVLKWQQDNREEADQLMDQINHINQSIVNIVKYMCKIEERIDDQSINQFNNLLNQLSTTPNSKWSTFDQSPIQSINHYRSFVLRLVDLFGEVRSLYHSLGARSGADIVPDSQLSLCRLIEAQPGVVAAGLPGAGGEDAIFVLSVRQSTTNQSTAFTLPSWSRALPSNVQVLPVQQLDQPMTAETKVQEFSATRVFKK